MFCQNIMRVIGFTPFLLASKGIITGILKVVAFRTINNNTSTISKEYRFGLRIYGWGRPLMSTRKRRRPSIEP
jgi:hypothetical protein